MARPTPGKQYTIVTGDNLTKIATIAYGDGTKWPKIYNANQTRLKSGDPNLIFPGEVILIPKLSELKNLEDGDIVEKEGRDKVRMIINDTDIPFQAISIFRTMDTAADGWESSIGWNPGDDENIDAATKPYGYQNASIYIGGKIIINGSLYDVTPTLDNNKRGKNLVGWSFTADAIDSTIKPPYEVSNYTLRQRAKDLIEPFGISIKWSIDDDLKFDKMTASPTDTVFSHLLKYAKQRGVLISSTKTGDLEFLRANTGGESVGTIEEGEQGFLEYTAKFEGRKRFNAYKAIGQSPGSNSKFEIAKDDSVPKSRMKTFNNPDTTKGDLKSAAEWERSKQLADALTIPFNATGFYAPNDELFQENTIITVKSPVLSIKKGFNFLIKRVNYTLENGGRSTKLSLVPPQVYTGEQIPDIFI